ncbi:hypothetical protein [Sphingobium sp. BHU LFT2]|nr:hypothetical protein [Sphingobium sp. BHU LFT2]
MSRSGLTFQLFCKAFRVGKAIVLWLIGMLIRVIILLWLVFH